MQNLYRRVGFVTGTALAAVIVFSPSVVWASMSAMSWVTVGNPGNVDTTLAGTGGLGSVAYEFRIGRFEVTLDQYCLFLNDAARADPYRLYNPSMASISGSGSYVAGITQSGSSGSFRYTVIGPLGYKPAGADNPGNRPIAYVSWFEAARYVNWLTSGSTESGAYLLNGGTSGTVPARNPAASFYLPTRSEWFKAACYSPTLRSGSGGYWSYATQSNDPPGNLIGSLLNQANVKVNGVLCVTQSPGPVDGQNYLTNVGSFSSSPSYYGTFDQQGNVWEWTESGTFSSQRPYGGSWNSENTEFSPSPSPRLASTEINTFGIRVASGTLPIVPWPEQEIVIDAPGTLCWTQAQAGYPLLSGVRPVRKIGTGTLVLDQNNPLLGLFSVQSGAVELNHSVPLSDSRFVLLAGGTLQMSGSMQGQVIRVGGLDFSEGGRIDLQRAKTVVADSALDAETVQDAVREALFKRQIYTSATRESARRTCGWLFEGTELTIAYAAAGDTDLDWTVDVGDIANFLAAGKYNQPVKATWADGDFNHDQYVDIYDVVEFLNAGVWGEGVYNSRPVSAVPEPRAIGLTAAFGLMFYKAAKSGRANRCRRRSAA